MVEAEIKLKTETPVHIGCGEFYLEADFILKNNYVKFIDYDKLFQMYGLDDDKLETLIQLAKEGEVKNKITEVFKISEDKIPFSREVKFVGKEPKRSLKIQKHIETRGKPFIPGSSIKGFIRTALLFKFLQDNPQVLLKNFERMKENLNKKNINIKNMREIGKQLEKEIFGKEPTSDALKYLKITDSTTAKQTVIYEVRVLGNPQTIPLYLECLPVGEILSCKIQIEEKFYNTDGKIGCLDLEKILEAVRCFTKEIIRTEKEYKRYEREVIEFYKKIEEKNVLRLGHSTGYFSKTIGVLLLKEFGDDFDKFRRQLRMGMNPVTKKLVEKFPKTRRITSENLPLGWVSYEVKT